MGKGQSFQQRVLGKLDIQVQKNEAGPSLYAIYKNYLKWIKNLNIGSKTVNSYEKT